MLLPFLRMTTLLENVEKSGSSRVVRENLGEICSCMWSVTGVLFVTQNMKERSSLLGKVMHQIKSQRGKSFHESLYKHCSE